MIIKIRIDNANDATELYKAIQKTLGSEVEYSGGNGHLTSLGMSSTSDHNVLLIEIEE